MGKAMQLKHIESFRTLDSFNASLLLIQCPAQCSAKFNGH